MMALGGWASKQRIEDGTSLSCPSLSAIMPSPARRRVVWTHTRHRCPPPARRDRGSARSCAIQPHSLTYGRSQGFNREKQDQPNLHVGPSSGSPIPTHMPWSVIPCVRGWRCLPWGRGGRRGPETDSFSVSDRVAWMIRVEIPTCRMSCFADGGLYRSRIACVLGVGMLLFLLFLSTRSAPHALAPLEPACGKVKRPTERRENCLTADPF
jgi:hypothetical protein